MTKTQTSILSRKYMPLSYDYLDKAGTAPHFPVNINIITPICDGWISETNVLKFKWFSSLKNLATKFYSFRGLPQIWENKKALSSLLSGNTVKFEELNMSKISPQLEGWNYISDNSDVEKLLKEACGFHDMCIVEINYISGSKNVEGGTCCSDNVRRVTIQFSYGGWCPPIELVFEGVTAFNLRPTPDNYSSDISCATLKLSTDETILFCVDEIENEKDANDSTWIKAFNLRWRFKEKSE